MAAGARASLSHLMARRIGDLQALIIAFKIGPTYGGGWVHPHAQPDDAVCYNFKVPSIPPGCLAWQAGSVNSTALKSAILNAQGDFPRAGSCSG